MKLPTMCSVDIAKVSTILQGRCTAISLQFCYTSVTPECNATKKGLTPNRRKSFGSQVRMRGFEPPRP